MAATQPLSLSGAVAGKLVLAGGGFMPARLLLAPVGARLPPGVQAVAVVAAAGSASRAIHLLPRAALPAPLAMYAVAAAPTTAVVAPVGRAIHLLGRAAEAEPGESGAEADDGEACFKGDFVFYDFITTQGLDGLWVLDEIVPTTTNAEFATMFTDVKDALDRAVILAAKERSDKLECALEVVRGWYGIVKLAHAAYPSAGLPLLPGVDAFFNMCADGHSPPVILGQAVAPLLAPLQGSKLLGPEVPDADAGLIKSVFIAVAVCQAAARTARARYVSGDPDI